MELLFFIFIAFILLVIIVSDGSEVKKTVRKDYTENFKIYYYSLPTESQMSFINSLDYVHKLQFEDYLKSENIVMPEFFINEFNIWTQSKDKKIDPFDLNNYNESNSNTCDDNIFIDCNFRNDDSVRMEDNKIGVNINSDSSNNDNSTSDSNF